MSRFRWMQVIAMLQCCSCAIAFSLFGNKIMGSVDIQSNSGTNGSPVKLLEQQGKVIVDNGISKVTLTIPDGTIVGVNYGGIDNLIMDNSRGHGYWDLNWNKAGEASKYSWLSGKKYTVVKKTDDQVELSFVSEPDSTIPLGFDKRFVMLRGVSGFYCYAIYDRPKGSVDMDMYQTRIVFKLNPDKFEYMAVSDKRKREMPTANDRSTGKQLAYPEAVLLTNPKNPELRGLVDDKYMYSAENKDINVHGWICKNPGVGFWVITPSYEFVGGGPMKQDLTSHVGPVSLAMFMSTHYAGIDITARFRRGEPWKKVYGPVFVYLNSDHGDSMKLWDDAKRQMSEEKGKWPYKFPMSKDFHLSDQRGTVSGELVVKDSKGAISKAYVGLAPPGPASSWERDNKGYQFWIQADGSKFQIRNVIPGTYNLYAWIPGYLGEYVSRGIISVKPGDGIDLGKINFEPVRDFPTLWEIGIPDRDAAEFFIPQPDPKLSSGLFSKNNFEMFREYGLWERYSELYPKEDLTFTVDQNKYQKDWFFAHVIRKGPGNTYKATTWKIFFTLQNVSPNTVYKLRIAAAAATLSELQVRINNDGGAPEFTTGLFGRDNAIARHGSHGLYQLFNIDIPGKKLVKGKNTLFLTQSRSTDAVKGIMYDYIRFEGPA